MKDVKDVNVEEQEVCTYNIKEEAITESVAQRTKELAEIYNQLGLFIENLRQDTEDDFNMVFSAYVDLNAVINNIQLITQIVDYIKETKFNIITDNIIDVEEAQEAL